jgi:hypothetical protein
MAVFKDLARKLNGGQVSERKTANAVGAAEPQLLLLFLSIIGPSRSIAGEFSQIDFRLNG